MKKTLLFLAIFLFLGLTMVFIIFQNSSKKALKKYEQYKIQTKILENFNIRDFQYHAVNIVASDNPDKINWNDNDYSETIEENMYFNITQSGSIDKDISDPSQLYSEKYLQLVNGDREFKSLEEEVNRILEENNLTNFLWTDYLLTSYDFGCPEESERNKCLMYQLRVNPDYDNRQVVNSGYLIKLQKKNELYRGFLEHEGASYNFDDVKHIQIPTKSIKNIKEESMIDKYIISRNLYSYEDYDYLADVSVDTYIPFYLSVEYNDKAAFIPITGFSGEQEGSKVYGLYDTVDYSKTFKEKILSEEYFQDEKSKIISKPITSIKLDEKYKIEGYLPNYLYLVESVIFGQKFYSIRKLDVEGVTIDVKSENIINEYGEDVYINTDLNTDKNLIVDLEENIFSFEIEPDDFWYVKNIETNQYEQAVATSFDQENKLRARRHNKISLEICVKFDKKEFLSANHSNEICSEYLYSLSIPDFILAEGSN